MGLALPVLASVNAPTDASHAFDIGCQLLDMYLIAHCMLSTVLIAEPTLDDDDDDFLANMDAEQLELLEQQVRRHNC